jgi:hypothetical protein
MRQGVVDLRQVLYRDDGEVLGCVLRLEGDPSIYVQHERVSIGSQLSDDERDPLSHQTADEVDVAAEPIELRDDDRALQLAGRLQSRGKLRPALKRRQRPCQFRLR